MICENRIAKLYGYVRVWIFVCRIQLQGDVLYEPWKSSGLENHIEFDVQHSNTSQTKVQEKQTTLTF